MSDLPQANALVPNSLEPNISASTNSASKTLAAKSKASKATASKTIASKTLAELASMHTGSLMTRRQALLSCAETSTLSAQDKASLFTAIQFKDTQVWQNAYRDLKSVLDKREHLPNKQERKAQRQARAKHKR